MAVVDQKVRAERLRLRGGAALALPLEELAHLRVRRRALRVVRRRPLRVGHGQARGQRLPSLRLLQGEPRANATSATPAAAPSSTTSQANAVGAAPGAAVATDGSHASEGPSALSRQVKGMRPSTDGPRQSVQRNVSAAFQSSIQRLDALFQSARERARAPPIGRDRV